MTTSTDTARKIFEISFLSTESSDRKTEFPQISSLKNTTPDPFQPLSRFNEGRFDLIISNSVIEWMEIIVVTILCGIVSASGLVANVINILVFFRQGALSSSSNVSLLALAFADIGCLAPLFCNSINYAIFLLNKDVMLFLTPQDFTEVFILWPHIMFMQISSWITVYIALERCLSVVFPLRVKMIFSAKRSLIVVSTIALVAALSFIPIYASTKVEEMQDFETNATKLIFSLNLEQFEIVDVSNVIQSIVLRILAVLIVFICTQITVYRVRKTSMWRIGVMSGNTNNQPGNNLRSDTTKSTSSSNISVSESRTHESERCSQTTNMEASSSQTTVAGSTTNTATTTNTSATSTTMPNNQVKLLPASVMRERRLVKIITVICTIFMVCLTPDIIGIFTLIFMENLYGISPWDNLIHMTTYVQFFFESINSSINIIVYYKMSTRYRLEFRRMFGLE